jgi:hypothetical protein
MFILSDNRKLTFEEKVARVEEVLKKYPNATRSTITNWTGYKTPLLDEMFEKGVKVPKKKKATSKTTSWNQYLGSLSGRRDR